MPNNLNNMNIYLIITYSYIRLEWTLYIPVYATETMPESQGDPARVDKIRLGRVAIC